MSEPNEATTTERVAVLRCDWSHVTLWPSGLSPLPDECPAVMRRDGRADLICGRELTRSRTLYGGPLSGSSDTEEKT